VREAFERVADQADLVLLAGDLTQHGQVDEVCAVADACRGLEIPTVAVLGNHDWRQFGARVWNALTAAGIPVLENDSIAIPDRRGTFHVAGLADLRSRRPDAVAALERVPEGEPVLMLAHDPDLFPLVPDRVSLTVAGHTHGGQIALPARPGRLPRNLAEFISPFHRGLYRDGDATLYVNRGLGFTGQRIRLFTAREIAVLTLRPAPPRACIGPA